MPQRHKGDRTLVSTRIPTPYFHKMERLTMITGQTKSDILSELLLAYLDKTDLDELESQEQPP